jgi:hypothetical protein
MFVSDNESLMMETGKVSKTGIYSVLTQVIEKTFPFSHNQYFKFCTGYLQYFFFLIRVNFICMTLTQNKMYMYM